MQAAGMIYLGGRHDNGNSNPRQRQQQESKTSTASNWIKAATGMILNNIIARMPQATVKTKGVFFVCGTVCPCRSSMCMQWTTERRRHTQIVCVCGHFTTQTCQEERKSVYVVCGHQPRIWECRTHCWWPQSTTTPGRCLFGSCILRSRIGTCHRRCC
jgi:hypothetical protein